MVPWFPWVLEFVPGHLEMVPGYLGGVLLYELKRFYAFREKSTCK